MDLCKTRGVWGIWKKDDYIILTGKKFCIYKKDGTCILSRPDVWLVDIVCFLPDDRVIISCSRKKSYMVFSLHDGSELAVIKCPKADIVTSRFALSPDGKYFYGFYRRNGKTFITRINLSTYSLETNEIIKQLNTVADILCDADNTPCLLMVHYVEVGGSQISENGIQYAYRDPVEPGCFTYWKAKWDFQFPQISWRFFGDTETILTGDLCVYKTKTGEKYSLAENSPDWKLPDTNPCRLWLDEAGRYLYLLYFRANVVIDIQERKVVAQYAAEYKRGCLIDGEYWISNEVGIEKKPFPIIEDLPPEKKPPSWHEIIRHKTD
jgi:WD40 repeat protein